MQTHSIRLVAELLPFFLAFIPFGLGFLIVASKARCRVCSCPLFYVRLCRKHQAAHYVPLVGIACSTALHLLFFKWMRCMYCGTAIRLRHRNPQVPAASGHEEAVSHTRVYRPWGHYQNLEGDDGFLVKRIVVNPGAKLSLQYHHKRAEHWIVVAGMARVTNGDEVFDLGPNQSTYIPKGAPHRLKNPGAAPLHLIEVQSGDYIGEDDITRLEDTYGRN